MALERIGLNFADMINRVAESLDVTTDTDGKPTDSNELRMIEAAINDTIIDVYAAHDWTWGEPEVTLSVGSDSPLLVSSEDLHKYTLPPGIIGQPCGRLTVSVDTGTMSGSMYVVDAASARRAINESPDNTGTPRIAAFTRELTATSDLRERKPWTMYVYPAPNSQFTISGKFESEPIKFTMESEVGQWGVEVDPAIVSGAVRKLAMRGVVKVNISAQMVDAQYKEALLFAIAKDTDRKPRAKQRSEVESTTRTVIASIYGT